MTTDWTFRGTWPFEPKWFDSVDGRMHYVDEGPRDGNPVVMMHGNPTWGYLYRNFIGPVTAAGHRAIVPDHLGFGRSDKPDRPGLYTIRRHAERLEALLESLDLSEATVVCQDWGGPTSLYWATRHPDRVRSLFILNTFAHRPPTDVELPLPLKLFQTKGLGEVMVKGLNLFVRGFLFRAGVVHRDRLTAEVKAAYQAPHPTYASRTAILAFPREIPAGPEGDVSDLNTVIESGLETHFRRKPVKVMWAMKDIAFTPDMLDQLWLRTFPDAEVTRIPDAGHYLQEDAHEVIVPELVDFLGR
ncbi:MAG: alpha/beta fold hydrolase [Acidimicrobiia bacterium]|nr:alpha/beta fold hydrolase [Acidimicrobiia bacterium]